MALTAAQQRAAVKHFGRMFHLRTGRTCPVSATELAAAADALDDGLRGNGSAGTAVESTLFQATSNPNFRTPYGADAQAAVATMLSAVAQVRAGELS